MKLLTKSGYRFATGMFWQIPDEGKRNINLGKLIKDTKHNMFCQCKTISPTWGFCHKSDFADSRQVASLGKFIVEASNLTSDYSNSIICYKFKNSGELADDGRELVQDLYGYIVLLNGTICPDEGEYVAEIAIIYESIISKAKKHEIETLYLPLEVAGKFFSIFEILSDAFFSDTLLRSILDNLTIEQNHELNKFIEDSYAANSEFKSLFANEFSQSVVVLKSFIKDSKFEGHLRTIKDKTLKYLISNVYILPFTSDEIYWKNKKFKANFRKSLIKPISVLVANKVQLISLSLIFFMALYLGYDYLIKTEEVPMPVVMPVAVEPAPVALNPEQLVNSCLVKNDRYFRDLGIWILSGLKCNSLGNTLTFTTDNDVTLGDFERLVGDKKNTNLVNKVGTYTQKENILSMRPMLSTKIPREQIINNLQQFAINYMLTLNLPGSATYGFNNFTITSSLSPVFLLKRGVLDNLLIKEIVMIFDQNTGFYSWTLSGEF